MIKYILIMKICSALHGQCLPEYNAGSYDSWYDCAAAGTLSTANALSELGPDLINSQKLYVTFKCELSNET
jgi:hypothetical protein